ncbi:hypothetical protein ACDY99_26615, partial [Achromobacter dolens]|uniref:hypothetical protein n=1 Tax=Achromobacter dolens TaxID=1287738 RepID=UPI00355619B4
ATMLLYQTHGAVTDFRGKLVLLAHKGSILSKVGASAKPGAIHSPFPDERYVMIERNKEGFISTQAR